jgi:hypothetical protein
MRTKPYSNQDASQREIVDRETVNNGEIGIGDRCLNPFCGQPVETQPGAVWIRTTCSNECRNMLSAVRRVAVALFPGLSPAEAIDTLMARVNAKRRI